MKREILSRILEDAGFKRTKDRYDIEETHRVTLYIGSPGRAMEIGEVESIRLADDFITVVTRTHGTAVYVEYEAIHAMAHRAPREEEKRRAGFS